MTQQQYIEILAGILAAAFAGLIYFGKRAYSDLEKLKTLALHQWVQDQKSVIANLQEKLDDARAERERVSERLIILEQYRFREMEQDISDLKAGRFEERIKNLQADAAQDRTDLTRRVQDTANIVSDLSSVVSRLEEEHHKSNNAEIEKLRSELRGVDRRSTDADLKLHDEVNILERELIRIQRDQGLTGAASA